MRNPKFEEIKPNYRKHVLEITLREGRKRTRYHLPFSVFDDLKIGVQNKFKTITIDPELAYQGALFVLEDGTEGNFPSDFVLYHCDPTYDWSPLNQVKRALKSKLDAQRLSFRVMADALGTSPAQVVRLLEENKGSKQLTQLFRLARLAGYEIELQLKPRKKRVA